MGKISTTKSIFLRIHYLASVWYVSMQKTSDVINNFIRAPTFNHCAPYTVNSTL